MYTNTQMTLPSYCKQLESKHQLPYDIKRKHDFASQNSAALTCSAAYSWGKQSCSVVFFWLRCSDVTSQSQPILKQSSVLIWNSIKMQWQLHNLTYSEFQPQMSRHGVAFWHPCGVFKGWCINELVRSGCHDSCEGLMCWPVCCDLRFIPAWGKLFPPCGQHRRWWWR